MAQPWVNPPPTSDLYLRYDHFDWCQIQYVFANELAREQPKIDWVSAYQEAGQVVEAIKASSTPLALGAQPGEVVWPILICAANRYAILPAERRQQERAAIAQGRPIWSLNLNFAGTELCDRAVFDDADYQPVPPCVPHVITSSATIVGGVVAGFLGTYLSLLVILSTKDPS